MKLHMLKSNPTTITLCNLDSGVLHTGYDNREVIREEYEVLCEDRPCSLKYLVAKKLRDYLKALEEVQSKKCATKLNNVLLSIDRLVSFLSRKVRESHLSFTSYDIGI